MTQEMAKEVLNLTDVTPSKIKAAFRVKVLVGHTDRGGDADITELIKARNLLLSVPIANVCMFCTEYTIKGLPTCAFHQFCQL